MKPHFSYDCDFFLAVSEVGNTYLKFIDLFEILGQGSPSPDLSWHPEF